MIAKPLPNPFRPSAGHVPPHLAGREPEIVAFERILAQDVILKNVILTGLRGVGKTVLMEDKYKPLAQKGGWLWVGSDFAEATFLSEEQFCTRLLTDLSVFTSQLMFTQISQPFGFEKPSSTKQALDFDYLATYFEGVPGLRVDKLKATLELVWRVMVENGHHGIVFAYDEAQVVRDRADKEEYPLAMMLETFQSLQRKGVRFMLLLTGLPTLFPKLVAARTYAERMFSIQELGRLTPEASRKAIEMPLSKEAYSRWRFSEEGVQRIIEVSDGYPYFIQFLCKETYDFRQFDPDEESIPIDAILRKLDTDFFAGRWEGLTDRQRDFLLCIAQLPRADMEFSISDVVAASREIKTNVKPFTAGDISQMVPRLIDKGLLFKNRFGKYSFAIPLFARFIERRFVAHASKQKA